MSERNDYDKEDMFQATFGKRPMTRKEKRLAEKEAKRQAKLDAKLAKQQAKLEAKEAKRRRKLEKKYGKHSAELSGTHSINTQASVYSGGGKHQAARPFESARPVKQQSKQPAPGKNNRQTTYDASAAKNAKAAKEKRISAQQSIPYREMGRDGICRVQDKLYSKTIRFYDINYQLAQNEDKNAIFENWCDFLNYFDSTIFFQLSFINHKTNMTEYERVIRITPQGDDFDDVRMEYAEMLKNQLAKGNNGLMRSKYITFAVEADSVREARPKLECIEADILNNFKVLGVSAFPLNGVERLQIMYETFNPDQSNPFTFNYNQLISNGLSTKDFIAPTSFTFRNGKYFMMGSTL